MDMNESISDMMDQIAAGDTDAARQSFSEIISAKVSERLENMKVDVASAMFNSEVNEATYSAKAAAAGKDIGKPGKNFEKIEKKAAEEYGSEEAGKRVAGAVLAKLRK